MSKYNLSKEEIEKGYCQLTLFDLLRNLKNERKDKKDTRNKVKN